MATEPLPPDGPDALSRLRRELWFARDAGESARVQELTRQIGRLTTARPTSTAPQTEDTSAKPPRRETASTAKSARTQPRRSPRVPRK